MPLHDVSPGTLADIRCMVHNSTAFSCPNNSFTAVTFDAEDYDLRGMHSTGANTSRIVVPVDGRYLCTCDVLFQTTSTTGETVVGFKKNGSEYHGLMSILSGGGGNQFYRAGAAVISALAGDYLELFLFQNTGGSVNIGSISFTGPAFEVQLLAPLGA